MLLVIANIQICYIKQKFQNSCKVDKVYSIDSRESKLFEREEINRPLHFLLGELSLLVEPNVNDSLKLFVFKSRSSMLHPSI
jgi:predicted HTH transcriptional regulator